MNSREPFGYVVAIEGTRVTLNLKDILRGHVASHRDGISHVTEVGGLFAVDGGTRLIVLRVRSLSFVEPREAHRAGVGSTSVNGEPLRHLEAVVMGRIERSDGMPCFTPDSLICPTLGAEAYPLFRGELSAVLNDIPASGGVTVNLGDDVRGGGSLKAEISHLLGRHVAVLGATGQGKSCYTAAVLQQLLRQPGARIVVFDINGEYERALKPHVSAGEYKMTIMGGPQATTRIPYYALGRHGLGRLFLPSEKTQLPALNFALDCLPYVQWFDQQEGVGLVGARTPHLFDDCRPDPTREALDAIQTLRHRTGVLAKKWPDMRALGCLVADSYCLQQGRGGRLERNAFQYSNVAPLIARIRRRAEDQLFKTVVEVSGGQPCKPDVLDWKLESSGLVDRLFGTASSSWKLHIINLRNVAHDLLPLVLGSLLELLAFELFRRGQGSSYPTLLVLEEAHHYLRQLSAGDESDRHLLAYERLAKEGRKFGLSLWVSTQRPSELSPTVLAQCGTWAVFRLTTDKDLHAVASAGEWVDRQELNRIAGLPRQQALVFGSSVYLPVRVVAPTADPTPKSDDPDFSVWRIPRPVLDESVSTEEVGAPQNTDPPTEKVEKEPEVDEDDLPF